MAVGEGSGTALTGRIGVGDAVGVGVGAGEGLVQVFVTVFEVTVAFCSFKKLATI